VAWAIMMAWDLGGNWNTELQRMRLALRLPVARIDELIPPYPGDKPLISADYAALYRELKVDAKLGTQAQLAAPESGIEGVGSNNWVVHGSHTTTGKPLLANDPHLGLSAPGTWYLARVVVPGFDIRGATAPGSPAILLGHNGRIGWGFTTTNLDSQDLFVEKLDPTDPARYVTPEGSRPFGVRPEVIRVRWSEPVHMRVRQTRHGVVISDFLPDAAKLTDSGHVRALTATALDTADTSAEGFFGLMLARDWTEFLDAARRIVSPMQNIVYADTEGNIGFVSPARIPLRRKGDGFLPVPGWTGEFDWAGNVPFEELPRAYNPPGGIIVNANGRVVAEDYRHFITYDWAEPYRQRQAHALLRRTAKHSIESMVAIQADNLAAETAETLPLLLAIVPRDERSRRAIAMLQAWDRRLRAEQPEPLIYSAWLRELHRGLYADELGDELFRTALNPGVAFLIAALRDHPAWCDDVRTPAVESCSDILERALLRALGELTAAYGSDMGNWRWGRAHIAEHRHFLLDRLPLLRDLASIRFAADGGMHSLNRATPHFGNAASPFAAAHGASYRGVYDFADLDRSLFAIPLGQSGNFLSPWYADAVEEWRSFRYRQIAGPRYVVERSGIGTLSLRRP